MPRGEVFLYLEEQYRKPDFCSGLADALRPTHSAYGRALTGLTVRGGMIAHDQFPIASGLPTRPTKKQILHAAVEQKLLELKVVHQLSTDQGEFIALSDQRSITNRRKATLLVETIILGALRTWLMKTGFSSQNKILIRGEGLPTIGQYRFDLSAPTFLAGLRGYNPEANKVINGFIAGDILLDHTVTLEDLAPFFYKCDSFACQKRNARLLPIFVADNFTEDGLMELRRRGCLLARPGTIFGEEIAAALGRLIATLENAAAIVATDPERIFLLMDKLRSLEGTFENLRSLAMQLMVGRIYSLDGFSIEFEENFIAHDGHQAEFDVKAANRSSVVAIECKALMAGNLIDAEELGRWHQTRLPRLASKLRDVGLELRREPHIIFWSATGYTPDAEELLLTLPRRSHHVTVEFLGGVELLAALKRTKERKLAERFKEQFMTASLTKVKIRPIPIMPTAPSVVPFQPIPESAAAKLAREMATSA